MTEGGTPEAPVAHPAAGDEPEALLAALRARGAEGFDPVGLRFLEALARRAAAHADHARPLLERRLAKAIADYDARLERAEGEAADALARGTARFPEAADALRKHCAAGDFAGLHRLLLQLQMHGGHRPLAELLAQVCQQAPKETAGGAAPAALPGLKRPAELKSVKVFRRTWSRLRVDQQLSDALAQAPENAGPLNSHALVLQSLKLMRDISPEYLEQFSAYVEALLWLEQAAGSRAPAPKGAGRADRGGKGKPGRGSGG